MSTACEAGSHKIIPPADGGDIPLNEFIDDMLEDSQFVYQFVTMREIVRTHGVRARQVAEKEKGGGSSSGGFFGSLFGDKSPKLVEFASPELIITDWGSQEQDEDKTLKYTLTKDAIKEFVNKNRGYLKQDGNTFLFDETGTNKSEFQFEKILNKPDNIKILDYDDSMINCAGGLCYAVIANLTNRSITVVFRGSTGLYDFWADHDFSFENHWFQKDSHKVNTPAAKKAAKEKGYSPANHAGFMGYLEQTHGDDNTRAVINRILACVEDEFENNPEIKGKGFRLFVTGHSLGGGLANLFAFRVAHLKELADDRVKHLPEVVRAMTFAAPCVGNAHYNHEFQHLEKKGLLRHIRIANEGDLVPTMAIMWPFCRLIRGDTDLYTQNGVNLLLQPNGKIEIAYRNTKTMFSQLGLYNSLNLHFLDEYERRVYASIVGKEVSEKTLEEIYQVAGDFKN